MEKGSSSSARPGSPTGLKFGKKIYYEEGSVPRPKTGGGPAKKGRAAAAGLMLQGYCQVEGCKVDLSGAKAYYSRHKVCGVHSKSPKVIVAGIEQRFCQQCSSLSFRFHQLPEFDQGKRSCRRRLAGHNERRRKPPQGYKDICPSNFDNNHTSKTGGFVMDFSAYPSSLTGRDPFANSALEQGLTTNISGKFELPWPSNSPQNPLSDLLTSRPSYSVGPVVSSQECFNGVSDSTNAPSLLSNQPLAGTKSRLVVNSFLGQPSDDNPGSAIGQYVCSPWILKGNGDLGLGQASQPSHGHYNDGLGLAPPSVGQFDELDQTSGYNSSSVGQHMRWSL